MLPETVPNDFFQVNGQSMFHLEKGEGDPAIVILHGLPDHSLNQKRLIEGLSLSSRVLAYDRKGMGLSSKPKMDYDVNQQTLELHQVLEKFHFKKPILLGHSLGGTLAVNYAALYPDNISGLILVNPTIVFEPGHTGLSDWNTRIMKQPILGEFLMSFHTRMVTKGILRYMFYDPSKVTKELIDSYHFPMQMKGSKAHFLGTLRSLYFLGTDYLYQQVDLVKKAKIPVLLFWTENDRNMPVSDGPILAEKLAARLQTIPNCGHVPQLELGEKDLDRYLIDPIKGFIQEIRE